VIINMHGRTTIKKNKEVHTLTFAEISESVVLKHNTEH
jgi:hypothetical protein